MIAWTDLPFQSLNRIPCFYENVSPVASWSVLPSLRVTYQRAFSRNITNSHGSRIFIWYSLMVVRTLSPFHIIVVSTSAFIYHANTSLHNEVNFNGGSQIHTHAGRVLQGITFLSPARGSPRAINGTQLFLWVEGEKQTHAYMQLVLEVPRPTERFASSRRSPVRKERGRHISDLHHTL